MKHNFDVIFLGGLFPKETENEILENSIGVVQNAANALQWNLILGLDENLKKRVKIVNSLYIGSYPKRYKKMFIKTYEFEHAEKSNDINVGFCNMCFLKYYFRRHSLKGYLKKWACDGQNMKVVIAYALTDTFVKSIKYIKKLNPYVRTCIVVPDLPQYMNTSNKQSLIYKILKKHDMKGIEESLIYVDSFVLLTEHMSKELHVKKYIVVEGIASDGCKQNRTEISNQDKIILYTGTLNERYGVLNLLEAFSAIKAPDYKLIICGSGDSESKIIALQKKDSRVVFKGQVSREAVLKLQNEATVMINPRQNTEEFTKYSFPSKNMEYLSAGKPLIAYKLDGIPDEYDDYIYYVTDNSVESLKNKIVEVCEKSPQELQKFSQMAQEFVLTKKNRTVQTEKILNLIESVKWNE